MKQAKVVAILSVLLMLAVCIVPFNDTENGLDAAVGDGEAYEYRIVYNSSVMSSSSAAISVADMTPISHTSTSALESLNAGSWTWDTTTGYGPFNSFYAAFDLTAGNTFYAILDPYNLTQTISGTALSPLANYNIMWVIPTVYWATDTTTVTNDTLVLSNDSSKGTAYAHTINNHVYNYLAIGVNEGSTTTVDGLTVLTSQSGVNPTVSQNRATFRTYAHNYTMDSSLATDSNYPAYSMLWNFNQWDLYKYCCYALMENFNSQYYVGGGHTFGSTYVWQTGALNTYGPYAGYAMTTTADANNGGSSVKLFIENAWGAINEFVDGIMFHYNSAGNVTMYIDTNATPTDATTTGTNVVSKTITTLSSSGYPGAISTDADIWGWGTASGGSATAGLTDYTYVNTSGDKVLYVGGSSSTNASGSAICGLSFASAINDTSDSNSGLGSRLAFVFDAGPASPTTEIDLDFTISDSGYGTLGDGTQTGQTTISLTDVTAGAVTINDTNKTISIDTYTITATPTAADDHWTYTFDGWYVGQTKLITGNTLSADATITAKFVQSLTLHNADVESNNPSWGTVSVGRLTNIPYGETFTVTDHTLSIYNQSVVAVEAEDTVAFEYSFDGFQTEGQPVTTGMQMVKDLTIRAIFTSTELKYTVIVQSNNTDYGTVDVASITNVTGGSQFTVSGTTLELAGTTVHATKKNNDAQYTYAFTGWFDALTGGNEITSLSTVTSNMNVYARFTATVNNYTVTIQDDGSSYGTVSPTTVANVPYGTIITASGNTMSINGTTVTATPIADTTQYDYTFNKWTIGQTDFTDSYQIVGNTTITANFVRALQTYTVTYTSDNTEYGTVTPSTVLNVPYGSAFTTNGNQITINGITATATPSENTPEISYFFDSWSQEATQTITGNTTITATFTSGPSVYTVTAQANDDTYGDITNPITPNIPYGTVITISNDELRIGSTTAKATPRTETAQYSYGFAGWKINGESVTGTYTVIGDVTFVADFTRAVKSYTITWNIDGVETTETYEYGATPTHATPTKDNYEFAGWNPSIEMVTQDQTYTATWTAEPYSVFFDGNGGTPTKDLARGSAVTPVVLPTATLSEKYLAGWYTEADVLVGYDGDNYYPTADITLYAHWSDVELYHFSVVYNANGGQGGPTFEGFSTETVTASKDFTVSATKPTYGGYKFLGWATTSSAEDAQYVSGDTVTVSQNASVTLYAVWEYDQTGHTVSSILGMIPVLAAIGLLIAIAGVFVTQRGKLKGDDIVKMMIAAVIGFILIGAVMVPIFGGL